MDVTEQAKRSDALYYSGNDGINRRWLCDKVASLEAALELCDSDARDHLRDFTAENAKLQAENVKLRELATLNWEWAHSCCGNNCKMKTKECGYGIDRKCNYECEIYDRMCELGVEVEE